MKNRLEMRPPLEVANEAVRRWARWPRKARMGRVAEVVIEGLLDEGFSIVPHEDLLDYERQAALGRERHYNEYAASELGPTFDDYGTCSICGATVGLLSLNQHDAGETVEPRDVHARWHRDSR